VGLNFAIKVTKIQYRSTRIGYFPSDKVISIIMFAKYNQTAFDQLQFNHNLLATLSQTTIVVHSRDDEGMGMKHKVILPKAVTIS